MQFNIGATEVSDEVHEVELKIEVTAKADQGVAFGVELLYCGLFGLRNVSDDQAHPFLFAEAPRLLFPFARAIISDAVRDAGFQPLMLDPLILQRSICSNVKRKRVKKVKVNNRLVTPKRSC